MRRFALRLRRRRNAREATTRWQNNGSGSGRIPWLAFPCSADISNVIEPSSRPLRLDRRMEMLFAHHNNVAADWRFSVRNRFSLNSTFILQWSSYHSLPSLNAQMSFRDLDRASRNSLSSVSLPDRRLLAWSSFAALSFGDASTAMISDTGLATAFEPRMMPLQ